MNPSPVVDRPLLLDLFCGAGGAAMGYYRAGFDVVGVDIRPQPRYPFAFIQADALDVIGLVPDVAVIHASPPCQRWAAGVKNRETRPDLIAPLRSQLASSGVPYVIENVPRAPLVDAITLCGGSLGCVSGDHLQLHRHRRFETNWPLMGVPCSKQRRHTVSVVGHGTPSGNRRTIGRTPAMWEKREAMGIDWMSNAELSESIPPAYTEYIGQALMLRLTDAPP